MKLNVPSSMFFMAGTVVGLILQEELCRGCCVWFAYPRLSHEVLCSLSSQALAKWVHSVCCTPHPEHWQGPLVPACSGQTPATAGARDRQRQGLILYAVRTCQTTVCVVKTLDLSLAKLSGARGEERQRILLKNH